ncbi:MAG: ATP-binding protein [Planctomycetia bacterium]|nr:ATP-binding protein [Planctomycetia bacterium]
MFEKEKKFANWTCEEVFPSISGKAAPLIDAVLKKMTEKKWAPKDIFAVNMALVESIANAIEHGNQHDPEKHVSVYCTISEKLVHISVKDEGPGFVSQSVPDPRNSERMTCPSGRGVFLIHGFMSKVWFSDSGNVIYMEKFPSDKKAAQKAPA